MRYEHILVAVDLTKSSKDVINKGISLAKNANSKLSFVYVDVDKVVLEPKEEQTLHQQLQTLADEADYPVTNTLVVIGDLHIKLSGLVKNMNIDLVVCGHHHKFLSRFSSSVPKLANAVEADLLVVYLS
ncbi:universal stress protein [Vibrio sinensis]|uniref:Universal stress protein n=1 Tax=Vibrio sinensis TaxID=2302434 RepID=A0A3A6QFT2_9VIBR|nr:universal stress protein [Vibrio sinensis]RJX71480.1 universal stress protein [Vibrio sinensis]